MSPRRRRLLLIVLFVLVAVPVLATVGVGSYLRSGGLEREIEHGWTSYGLPGRLDIGDLRLIGVDEAEATDVEVRQDGQPPLARARKVRLRFDLVDRRLLSLRIDGVQAGLDAQRYRFLLDIIKAEQKHPPTRAPKPVTVEVVDGNLELPGGLLISEASVLVQALGVHTVVEGSAKLAGRPLRVAVTTDRATQEAPIITSIEVREGSVSPAAALIVVEGLGMISETPPAIGPWLPALADATGTKIQFDVVSNTIRGTATAQWIGGKGWCTIEADARRLILRQLSIRDAKLGAVDGQLTSDRAGTKVAFDATMWSAGPGLPLPSGLPLADVARVLPELQVRWPTSDHRTTIGLLGPGGARLEVTVGGNAPARLTATELPLVLLQGLLPPSLVLGGGHIVQASAVLAPDRPEFSARLSQARMLIAGWSFGPLDSQVAAVLVPGGTVQVSADLLSGEQAKAVAGETPKPIGRISFAGSASSAHLTLECEAVESLLARLRGPGVLPDLTGRVAAIADVSFSQAGVQVEVRNLDLVNATFRMRNHDFIRALTAKLSGQLHIAGGKVDVSMDCHLRSGELRIPGRWLNLAERTPRFTLDVSARHEQSQLTELVLSRAMVRAADQAGEAVPGGFSAQFDGRLAGERLAGTVQGVFDHFDLAWIAAMVIPGPVQVTGEGAVVFQVHLDSGELSRIDGSFLPLGAALDIERGKLKVDGITGGVRFTIGGEAKP